MIRMPIQPVGNLDEIDVRRALDAASSAPSLHNSQPWRFVCTTGSIELLADSGRSPQVADRSGRAVYLACGAALMNLRLAIRAAGVVPDVRVMPDPDRPDLIAVVDCTVLDGPMPAAEQRLAMAIPRRHTHRSPFMDLAVPPAVRGQLRAAARMEHGWLAELATSDHATVRELLRAAHRDQQTDPLFTAEWTSWMGRGSAADDGVPTSSSGPAPEQQDMWVLRDFADGQARARVPGRDFEAAPLVMCIGSFTDLRSDQVTAGQAMQRVLLTATAEGLMASFLSQLIEVDAARRALRGIIGGGLWPQAVLRLGYGSPGVRTPRRRSDEVSQTVI